jgi:tetratricopeptide (TPR) repeat protein
MTMEVEPILVGREEEVERIIGHLGEGLSGRGSLVLISGEAGIGKTRVMNAAADIARKIGFIVLMGRCIPGNPCPYLPFYEAFNLNAQSLFEDRSATGSRAMKDSSIVLFKVLDFLSKESEKTPILICVDDLHWSDSVTVQLLHFLARNIRSLRVAITGTYRTEDIIAEEGESVHPLRDTIRLMVREGIVDQIHLNRLEDQAIIEAVESMLGGRVHKTVSHRIVKESGGNPLFAVETVRMLVTSELIVLKEGLWMFPDRDTMTIPSTVQEVILRRLERLPRDQRRLLECASVVGKFFDPKIIEQILKLDRMQALDSLDSLENRFQLVKSVGEEYCFEHDKIREVAYNQIAPLRRKELHKQVGIYLESRLQDDRSLATLSFHFHQAGQREKSLDYSIRAGEYFLGESGGAEAVTFFQRAMDSIPVSSDQKKERLRALIGLGDSFVDVLNFNSAQSAYDQALSLELEPCEEGQLLWRMAKLYGPTSLGKGSTALAWEYIDRALSIAGMDDFDIGSILAEKANLAMFEGKLDVAERSYDEAEMMLRKSKRKDRLMDVMNDHAGFLCSLERMQEAISKMESLFAILSESTSSLSSLKYELGLAELLITIGDEEKAAEHLRSAHTLASKLGHNLCLYAVHNDSSRILMMRGDYLRARDECLKTLEIAQAIEESVLHARACAVLAQVDIMTGMMDDAEELIDRSKQLTESYEWSIKTPARGLIILAQAMLQGLKGRNEECIRQSENAMDVLSGGVRDPNMEAISRQSLGIFLSRLGNREKAFEQLTKAREIFLSHGNGRQVTRIDVLLTELESNID